MCQNEVEYSRRKTFAWACFGITNMAEWSPNKSIDIDKTTVGYCYAHRLIYRLLTDMNLGSFYNLTFLLLNFRFHSGKWVFMIWSSKKTCIVLIFCDWSPYFLAKIKNVFSFSLNGWKFLLVYIEEDKQDKKMSAFTSKMCAFKNTVAVQILFLFLIIRNYYFYNLPWITQSIANIIWYLPKKNGNSSMALLP